MIALADVLADVGFAMVAIDQPLHGIVDTGNPLHVGTQDGGLRERTFGLDLAGGGPSGNLPDGTADDSGAHFVNIGSPQTQRDNLRQAVADLFAVVKVIQDDWDIDGAGAAEDLDDSQIHFVGVSFGGIIGTVFCAADSQGPAPVIKSAMLSVPGGGLPKMLAASEAFGPGLLASLAAVGVVPGTPEYEQLMTTFQSVVDSGDPINFSPALGASSTPVLLHEVIGGGPQGSVSDQVVPNAVLGAPLSGTEPMIAAMGLTSVGAAGSNPVSKAAVRFIEGVHGSLLDPDPEGDGFTSPTFEVFAEMQIQVSNWVASIATVPTVIIGDDSLVQQP
jgi:pimeloyl-ACP methyl ester carboxylesterase